MSKIRTKTTISHTNIYLFEDSKASLRTTIWGNIILFLTFIFGGINNIYLPQAQLSLYTGVLLFFLYMPYRWRSSKTNWMIASVYLVILILEIGFYGIPNSLMEMDEHGISKGFLLDLFLFSLPYLYVAIRALLIIPLIFISLAANKIKIREPK